MATGTIKQPESYSDFSVTEVTVVDSVRIDPADYAQTQNMTVTNEGYYPLGIVGWSNTGTGSSYGNIPFLAISDRTVGSCKISTFIRNISTTSPITSMTLKAKILWMKVK